MNHLPKELRRALQSLDSIARRKPLNPAQRQKLEKAIRVLERPGNLVTRASQRRLHRAAAQIAELVLEMLNP